MRCHYEVLGLEQDCDDSNIKTAYRKLALRYHPDKNLDSPEEAKQQFLLVQAAYEVLSDPQERAFYDKHRDQILRGKNSEYEDNCLDLFQYFTVSCFKGYTDESGSFYDVYAKVFETIATEDAEFMDDEDEIEKIPKFGNSQSNYEETVGPFYAYWSSYCTKRTYSWLCRYDITEIKDRRILREIEKETKKLAQKAKKERNEEVRNLVSFIRKRDRRVQANKKLLEEKAEANRQKQQQIRLDQIKKRQQEIAEVQKSQANCSMNAEFEEQLRQLEKEYQNSESDFTEDDEEDEYDELLDDIVEDDEDEELEVDFENLDLEDLYCPACEKEFTHENAFKNHISTKKHKDNVEKLKKEMNAMEDAYQESQSNGTSAVTPKPTNQSKNINISADEIPELSDDEDILAEDDQNRKPLSKSKKKKKAKVNNVHEDEEVPDFLSKQEDDSDWDNDKKSKKGKASKKSKKSQKDSVPVLAKKLQEDPEDSESEEVEKVKRTKSKKSSKGVDDISDVNHVCVTCKAEFESKNKLFTHLKKMNHGVYIPKKGAQETAAGGKKKGKK